MTLPMESKHTPEIGDFVVVLKWGKYCTLGPVSKVTAKMMFHPDGWNSALEARSPKDIACFAGPEAAAKRVAEQLTSSAALCKDERTKADIRHQQRVASILAKAEPNHET